MLKFGESKFNKMDEDITLEQCQSGSVVYPYQIRSGGLGPCIAIGIYDKKKRRGYMIHESNASHNQEVPTFIENVLKKSKKDNLTVYVAGGEISNLDEPEDKEYTQGCRDYVKEELDRIFDINQIIYNWNNTPNIIELILSTEDGKFHIE